MRATTASTDRSPQQAYECTVWRSCIGSTSPSLTLANSKIIGMKSAAATVLYLLFCVPLAQAEPPAQCQTIIYPDVLAVHDDLATVGLPAPDYLDRVLECNAGRVGPLEPVASHWLEAERVAYSTALAKTPAQIIVAPFQVQGLALDRVERALMSIDLTYALAAQARVPDPTLVARALGEGSRRIAPAAILDLARRLKARKVLVPFVGHDGNHTMTITIQVLDLDTSGPSSRVVKTIQRDWRAIPFTDDSPPFETFHQMLPKILAELSLPPVQRSAARPVRIQGRSLSISPHELVAGSQVPASVALSLLGALASPTAELARQRLYVRALVASLRFDGAGAQALFIQAHALMGLDHRPAALALLRNASSPDGVALRALLNGDLPGARGAVTGVVDPLERLLLQIGIEDLRQEYNDAEPTKFTAARALFGSHLEDWVPLLKGRLGDANSWAVDPAPEIKHLLDVAFPLSELELSAIATNEDLLRPTSTASLDVVIDVASARHVRKEVAQLALPSCCNKSPVRGSQWDLLWLLEGRAEARVLRQLQMVSGHQGNTRRALSLLDDYEPFFSGNPGLAAERALAASSLAMNEPDDLRASRIADAQRNGLLVAEMLPGESQAAFRGIGGLGNFNRDAATLYWHVYGYDFPRRSYWPPLSVLDPRTYEASTRESLLYSTMDLDPIADVPQHTDAEKEALAEDLRTRFIGAPGRTGILALLRPSTAPLLDPIEELRSEISQEPNTWLNYYNLGLMLVRRHDDFAAAAKLFLSYPQFQMPEPPDAVALSDEAYQAGSYLYLHGHTELSEPLYRIAADLNTGSEASITAASRLLQLAGNFDGAMGMTLARAKSYPNAHAYRDYLSYLHATGHNQEVWVIFPQLASEFELPLVWTSALVGHRIQERSDAYVRAWLERPEIRGARLHAKQFAPGFALMWSATDRMPAPDLGGFVASLADPSTAETSDLAAFAAAYTEVRHARWEQAATAFVKAEHYPYGLAYRAMATAKMAAKTGDLAGAEKRR